MTVIFFTRDLVNQSTHVFTYVRIRNKTLAHSEFTGQSIGHDGVDLFVKSEGARSWVLFYPFDITFL